MRPLSATYILPSDKLLLNDRHEVSYVQGTSKRPFPGLVNFVPAVAYHFCLNLPAAFSQPGNGLLEVPCTELGPGLLGCVNSRLRVQ